MNDGFNSMDSLQLFFTVIEAGSFGLVLYFMDDYMETKPFGLLVLTVVSFFHFVSRILEDEFISEVIYGYGTWSMVISDLSFVASDFLICVVALYELKIYAVHKKRVGLFRLLCRRPVLIFSAILFLSLFLISVLMS